MKGVLVGTDYVKDTDGSFKVLEINTNVGLLWNNASNYFLTGALDSIISGSGYTEAHLIKTSLQNIHTNDLSASFTPENMSISAESLLIEYLTGSGMTVTVHNGENGIVPDIEDSDSKFIFRQAYDQTALFDENYCKDNFNFLKTVYDQDNNAIPKTFIPNTGSAAAYTFDSIGSSFRDNGNYPNYLIKERYPTTDYSAYPKICKAADAAAVTSLKNGLLQNEYLQEYILDSGSLVDGKLPTYRTIEFVYGSNLDRVNMTKGKVITALTPLSSDIDLDDNNQVQSWDRPKFIHKTANYHGASPIGLDSNLLLSGSNINISGSELQVNTVLKTFDIPDLAEASDTGSADAYRHDWSGSAALAIASGSLVNTQVDGFTDVPNMVVGYEITLSGSKHIDIAGSSIVYIQSGSTDKTEFVSLGDYLCGPNPDITGYKLMVYDNNTSELSAVDIEGVKYFWAPSGGYTMDVEDVDTFFLEDGTDSNTFFIVHNACNGYQFNMGGSYCSACGPNTSYYGYSGQTMCCDNSPYNATSFYTPSCTFSK
jgi:hypothetical protein